MKAIVFAAAVALAVTAPVALAMSHQELADLQPGIAYPRHIEVDPNGHFWRRVIASATPRRALRGAAGESAAAAAQPSCAQYDQKLNHSDPSSGTFKQWYCVDPTQWTEPTVGPIFLNINGEGPMSHTPSPARGYLADLAQAHGGLVLNLEHRFYGDSVPGGDMSTANLAHLTIDNVMADIAGFLTWYRTTFVPGGAASTNKVVTVGGSYSGALSAWFRIAHPEITHASWSSSGVVNALFEFPQFDEEVANAAGAECAGVMRKVTAALEAANGADPKGLRAKFGAPADMIDPDFFYMTADSGAMAVQYGSRTEICATLQAAAAGGEDLVDAFVNFTNHLWGPDFGANCFYDTTCLISDKARWQPTSRAWRWEKCTITPYLQVAPAMGSIRSKVVDIDALTTQCTAVFGAAADPAAASKATLAKFGGATPHSSNIFFSNGGDDPWQEAAVKATLSTSMPEYTAHCADCGHCGDMSSPSDRDPPELTSSRHMLASYMAQWLSTA